MFGVDPALEFGVNVELELRLELLLLDLEHCDWSRREVMWAGRRQTTAKVWDRLEY